VRPVVLIYAALRLRTGCDAPLSTGAILYANDGAEALKPHRCFRMKRVNQSFLLGTILQLR
jgi:hypothetical protein